MSDNASVLETRNQKLETRNFQTNQTKRRQER